MARILVLFLLAAGAAFPIAFSGGSTSTTITYTRNVSLGVVYLPLDVDYDTADYIEIVSGSVPPGVTWGSYGWCAGTKLCTAYYGTPTSAAAGVYTHILRAHHLGSSADLTVVFQPAFSISGTVNGTAVVGATYNSTALSSSGGTGTVTWSISVGSLPPGLSIDSSSGAISGTPTTTGTYTFTVQAVDSTPLTTTSSQTITVYAALSVTTASLPATTVGASYSQTLTSSGGTTPRTWSITAGSLPSGLTLNSLTGEITGPATAAGTVNFTAEVGCCTTATASALLSILVNPAPSITTGSLPGGVSGVAYSQTLTASGGTGALTWSVSAGSPPSGLTLSGAGVLSGTPGAAGTSNFTARVQDTLGVFATQAYTVTIVDTLVVTTASFAQATVGGAVTTSVSASGGTSPYTFQVSVGSLPTGLNLSSGGAISGTPSASGAFSFTIQAMDSGSQSATRALTWTVNAAPAVSPSTMSATTVGASYSQTFTATGGTGSITWSATGLPGGLSISAAGVVSGTPGASGTFSPVITARDANNVAGTASPSLVVNPAPVVTTASLPQGSVGSGYSQALSSTGGTGTITWSVSGGALPAGLTLSAGGVISGMPITAGAANFTARAQDSVGIFGQQALSITVIDPPSITTTSLATATVGGAVATNFLAAGGTSPYTYSISAGGLPPGITLSPSGALSGTPTTSGTYVLVVQVTDSASSFGLKSFTWLVNPPPSVSPSSMNPATVGGAYTATFTASGGTGAITFTASGLPAGLTISAGGVVSGTPSVSGGFPVTITARDSNNVPGTVNFNLTVNPAPSISTATLPRGVTGTAYSQTITATGGTAPIVWSITGGALPPGLTFAAGSISGTPSTGGLFEFTVQVTDANGVAATRAFSIEVRVAVTFMTTPPGLVVTVDSQSHATPVTFEWASGSQHTFSTPSPQQERGGSRYRFDRWTDNGPATRTIAPASASTYTANFVLEFRLTTVLNPPDAANIETTPFSFDGYFAAGTAVEVRLVPREGFAFANWTGDSTSATNPVTISMDGPKQLAPETRSTCSYSLNRSGTSVMPSGDLGRVMVATLPSCAWTAAADSSWIAILSGSSGSGNGTVRYQVAPNPSTVPRSGQLTIAGIAYAVHQSSAGCTFTLNPVLQTVGVAAAGTSMQATAPPACLWAPVAVSPFLGIDGDRQIRQGSASANVTVQANGLSAPRVGTIEAGGQSFLVVQQGRLAQQLYTDVPADNPYAIYVSIATLENVMTRCEANRFCPDTPVTRADTAEYIVRALLGDNFVFPSTPYFSDVPSSHPRFRFIQKLRQLGISKGCTATQYCPNATTNRGEMAVFLTRADLGISDTDAFPHTTLPYFADVPQGHLFFAFIQKIRESAVTIGCSATQYCPGDLVTRAQMATFLSRSLLAK